MGTSIFTVHAYVFRNTRLRLLKQLAPGLCLCYTFLTEDVSLFDLLYEPHSWGRIIVDNTPKWAYHIAEERAMNMDFDLSGFQTVHLNKKNGSILREKRVVLGLTQKQVAERAKITLRQYQKFESGERNIMTCSFQMACRIIEALGMNISDFYHNEYIIGEEVYMDSEGLKYKKTGRLTSEDVE